MRGDLADAGRRLTVLFVVAIFWFVIGYVVGSIVAWSRKGFP